MTAPTNTAAVLRTVCASNTEIVQGIKARLGRDFPVSVRFCGDEFTPHIPKTRTVEDAAAIARVLEAAGARRTKCVQWQ